MPIDDSSTYHLLKTVQSTPTRTQRELADSLGISLGKTNYCVKALTQKGLIKIERFIHSDKKTAYAYILTPKGLEEKSKVTFRFLQRKMEEYETLQQEISELQEEIALEKQDTLDPLLQGR